MAYNYLFQKEASEDLDGILDYIVTQLKNPKAAQDLLSDILDLMNTVSAFPHFAPLSHYPKLRKAGVRQICVKNFTVFYVVDEKNKRVVVVRIRYAKSDLTRFTP